MSENVSAEDAPLKAIEDLIVGSGAEDFRALERMVDVFCPFEAIGMVNQEIRHSHYLAYILDPNRPHGFGDTMLQSFLQLVAENEDYDFSFSKLDLHFWDGAQATVRREWKNIDLLIELPTPEEEGDGLVVAVELKINASESEHQLEKYKSTIKKEYKGWKQAFVFLTKDFEEAAGENKQIWMPLSLEELLNNLVETVKRQQFSGPSSELFYAYCAMLRRHHLSDTEIEDLAKKIWDKHREALEILYDNWPNDYLDDVWDELYERRQEIAKSLSKKIGTTVVVDGDNLRFTVEAWDSHDEMRSGTGVWSGENRDRKRILSFFLGYGKNVHTKMLLGPSNNEIFRALLLENFNRFIVSPKFGKMQIKKPRPSKKWTTLSTTVLQNEHTCENAKKEGTTPEKFAAQVEKQFVKKWSKLLPLYLEVVEAAIEVE